MEFEAERQVLASTLQQAFAATARSAMQPIYQQVLLTADDDGLVAIGSDGEITIRAVAQQVQVSRAGSCLIAPRVLTTVTSLPDASVALEVREEQLRIGCRGFQASFALEPSASYPPIDFTDFAVERSVLIDRQRFLQVLRRVRPPISGMAVRPSHAYIQVVDGVARGYNGAQLHQLACDYPFDALLSARVVTEIIRRMNASGSEAVAVAESERGYAFWVDGTLLLATRPSVQYPDADRQIVRPTAYNDQELIIDRVAFTEAVRRVAATADRDTGYLSLDVRSGALALSAFDRFGSASLESIDAQWAHADRVVGVNWRYLLEMLMALTEDRVHLKFRSSGSPQLLRFEETGFLGVLVQLRADLGVIMQTLAQSAPVSQLATAATRTESSVALADDDDDGE